MALTICGGAVAAETRTIDLAKVRIEVADKENVSQAIAAEELERHLALLSGERRPAADGFVFRIGTKAPGAADTAAWTSQAQLAGEAVYFWGDDAMKPSKKKRIARYGSLFAAYGFLEEVCGVKWVRPGDDGIILRPTKTVNVPSDWTYRFYPPLGMSVIRARDSTYPWLEKWEKATPGPFRITRETAEKRSADDARWMLRQRHQTREVFGYGHAYVGWNPKYIHSHPEYLAMDEKGVRGNPQGPKFDGKRVQLCLSNTAAQDQIIADWLEAGTNEYLNVCPNDSHSHCHCKDCCAWDADEPGEDFKATKSDRYVKFWNILTEKAMRYRPDVKLVTYIYANWRYPTRREKIAHPDNFIGGIVPSIYEDSCALIREWNNRGMKHYFVRPNYLAYGCAMPRGLERFLFDDFKRNLELGMMGVDEDNWKRGRVMDFEIYALARVIADPSISFETVEKEFLSQFGEAASEMGEYYRRARARGEASRQKHQDEIGGAKRKALDDSLLSGSAFDGHTEADMDGDLAVIDRALAKPGLTDAERRRVREMRLVVENAKLALRFVTLSTAGHSDNDFRKAGEELLAFRLAHKDEMTENWGALFRAHPVEVRLWMRMKLKKRFPEIKDPGEG